MPLHLESSTLTECGPHRTASRCVSWNASGQYVAFGTSDRLVRLCTVESGGTAREVLVVTGHQAAVTQVKFHPVDKTLLATAALDKTVRIWDCRNAKQRDVGTIDCSAGGAAVALDWCGRSDGTGNHSHALAVTERDGRVVVYDTRQLSTTKTTAAAVLHVASPHPKEVVETAIFGPGGGAHILAASQLYQEDTTCDVSVWNWTRQAKRTAACLTVKHEGRRFPAHTEGIYSMALSPDGRRLATGGADAIVALWDTSTMVCTHTDPCRTKYIRSVAFSHDSQLVAHCTEENDVHVIQASDAKPVGQVSLGARRGGAEQIAWHPSSLVLACAKADTPTGTNSPIVIAKLSLTSQ